MAGVEREIHLSSSSSVGTITKEKVLSILKDSGVTDKDIISDVIVTDDGTFIIKVSQTVASMIIRNKDKYPSTWVLAVPSPVVSVTISYGEKIFPVKSGSANAKSAVINDSTIATFLDELKASTKVRQYRA